MDLTTNNNNNNNNNDTIPNSKPELGQGPPGGYEDEKKKSEQFVKKIEDKKMKKKTLKSLKDSFKWRPRPTSLGPEPEPEDSKTSNIGGEVSRAQVQAASVGRWMEETSFSGFRLRPPGGGGGGSLEENKIDREIEMEGTKMEVEVAGGFVGGKYQRLARVDPIVDFFTVDEELLGRFRIFSWSGGNGSGGGSGGDGGIQQQQAIIFKIKTTSPYSFWVRPIYGLMRPNVMAWVEVKCEMKGNSMAKLEQNMDEFLVEICPVPGAIHTMTSDLYTNCVHSNLPELVGIWEKVEQELIENQLKLQGFCKEFHKVSCRFQRSPLVESIEKPLEVVTVVGGLLLEEEKEKNGLEEERKISIQDVKMTNNNNEKNFQWNPFDTNTEGDATDAKNIASKDRYRLARELLGYHQHQVNTEDEGIFGGTCGVSGARSSLEQSNDHDSGEKTTSRCCCSCGGGGCCRRCGNAIRKICCCSFILLVLLMASWGFIFYSQFYEYNVFGDKKNYRDHDDHEKYFEENNKSNNKRWFYR